MQTRFWVWIQKWELSILQGIVLTVARVRVRVSDSLCVTFVRMWSSTQFPEKVQIDPSQGIRVADEHNRINVLSAEKHILFPNKVPLQVAPQALSGRGLLGVKIPTPSRENAMGNLFYLFLSASIIVTTAAFALGDDAASVMQCLANVFQ